MDLNLTPEQRAAIETRIEELDVIIATLSAKLNANSGYLQALREMLDPPDDTSVTSAKSDSQPESVESP